MSKADIHLHRTITHKLQHQNKILNNIFMLHFIATLYKTKKYAQYFFYMLFKSNNTDCVPRQKKELALNQNTDFEYNFHESILLSIIIPAYNVEQYIENCVDSIIRQNIPCEYEIIIVEDCSTDNTKDVIKKISQKYSQVKIIYNEKNGGLSAARNTGLNNIKGKYVTFIDSDDLLCNQAIEKSINYIIENNDVDVVGFNYKEFSDESKALEELKNIPSIPPKLFEDITTARIPGFAWGKIYHRKMFADIRFPNGLYWEDGIILKVVMQRCKKYVDIGIIGYLYRMNPNSITSSIQKRNLGYDQFYMINYCSNELNRLGIEMNEYIYRIMFLEANIFLNNRTTYLPDSDVRYMFSEIIKIIDVHEFTSKLSYRQKCMLNAIRNKNVKAWRIIAF
ncbi:glycosyltransferase family 2 protein [Acinetobacter baumannii]